MASGDVTPNGVATTRENLAREQSFAYGRFALGSSGFLPVFFLLLVCLSLGGFLASSFEGTLKAVVFAVGCSIPIVVVSVAKLTGARFGARKMSEDSAAFEEERISEAEKAIASARARGEFDRFGK